MNLFFSIFGLSCPISGRGSLSMFQPILPVFGFRAVFHSMPGGLTCKRRTILNSFSLQMQKQLFFAASRGEAQSRSNFFGIIFNS